MIEAPEARILCRQLNETVRGKKITDVYTQFSPHKFAWFTGSSEEYAEQLSGKTIDHAQSQGGMVEITIGDKVLILTDGSGFQVTRQTSTAHRLRGRKLPRCLRENVRRTDVL